MQQINSPDNRQIIGDTDARAGRIIKGGAIRRILIVSVVLAVIALFVTYFLA